MEALFLLFVVLIVLTVITVLGHAIWLMCGFVVRAVSDNADPTIIQTSVYTWRCPACTSYVRTGWDFCGDCGTPRDSKIRMHRDLAAMQHQLEVFSKDNRIDVTTLERLSAIIEDERTRLTNPQPAIVAPATSQPDRESCADKLQIIELPIIIQSDAEIQPAPTFYSADSDESHQPKPAAAPLRSVRSSRRSFTEVLNSFMEESNIRWGEIIGGLLIIGCSTALVVSLWSQISQIPVLKFLIFTTVTAVLFGIGIYTERRWKLPTTSRGILTIGTLLVPLNFLAIAAVSSGDTSGPLVLASELLAPAIFLCLVYFAGRMITPACSHLLAGGVLGSSVGQLLVRHFATPDTAPLLLVMLGAFPVFCYAVAVGLTLRVVLKDNKIDQAEVSTVFTILGTMSFAALLPFGLLLYKSGPFWMSMMYLAPIVTLWGVPLLATGTVLWRRVQDRELVASRTAGTALGILGLMIAILGMILAWPNPASIVSAALLNFAMLTILAVLLDVPIAHFFAAGCFALAYLVYFHVLAGHVRWENLRVTSLVDTCLDISSGQALIGGFAIFLVVSEWLQRSKRRNDSYAYLTAACVTALVSLAIITAFGPIAGNDLQTVWSAFLAYSAGAFWIAVRRRLPAFTWLASALFVFGLASCFAWNTDFSFPWQTTLLVYSSLAAIGAVSTSQHPELKSISQPLNYASLTCLLLAAISLFQTNPWQVTAMQAERIFWIAGILLLSLGLNRRQLLFTSLQIALTAGVILTIKATLQQYDWYTYLPHAFLHPAALQIQGTFLALLSLMWIGVRVAVSRSEQQSISRFWKLLDTRQSVDRLIPWILLAGFVLLSIYGATSGIIQEFASRGTQSFEWNLAGFPHSEAFGIGSWVVLGLLTIIMLANAWERRQRFYTFGAGVAICSAIPLLAGRFESEFATATAWRFFAALFFAIGSVVLWYRESIRAQLKTFDVAACDANAEEFERFSRMLLISLTVIPLLLFTLYPTLRAVSLSPVQTPQSGLFALLPSNLSYATPLIIVALVLIGHSIRERAPIFSFYAGLVFNTTVTLAYLFSLVSVGAPINSVTLVRTIQLNAITFAVYGLFWLTFRKRWWQFLNSELNQAEALLKVQVWLAVGLNLSLIGTLVLAVLFGEPGDLTLVAGDGLGWFAFVISFGGFLLVERSRNERLPVIGVMAILLSLLSLVVFGVPDNLNQVRVLTLGMTVFAWTMFAASFLSSATPKSLQATLKFDGRWSPDSLIASTLIGGVASYLSLRIFPVLSVRHEAWGSVGPLLALCGLAAALQSRTLKRGYLYAAGVLLMLAVSTAWIGYIARYDLSLTRFFEFNIVGSSVGAILWLWLELRSRRLMKTRAGKMSFSYHNVIAIGSVALLIALTWFRFVYRTDGEPQFSALTWMAWLASVVLMFSTLWDPHARYATAGLYVLGLLAFAIALQSLPLLPTDQAWAITIFLAIYALGTTLLWRKRSSLFVVSDRLGITPRLEAGAVQLTWLSIFTILSVLVVTFIAYLINLHFGSIGMGLTSALAVIAQAITLSFLAEGVAQAKWRRGAIAAFLIGTLLFGWAWLTPQVNATWLNRSVILLVETCLFTFVFGLFLRRIRERSEGWALSLSSAVPALLLAGLVALVYSLGTELFLQIAFGAVLVSSISQVAIASVLVAAAAMAVWFALSATHDPLNLRESSRAAYVYVAELMLGLLFLHVRLTMPWLFTGFFERYWPFVVMVIAFVGVLASDALRRRNRLVLSRPLERTVVFLPLLPVVGFWIATSEVDYSSLLFVVGGLYGLLSSMRRSFVFGVLAGVAGNTGLWYLLHETQDYQFFQHPQLWLVPVALSVLLAAYLNEDKFSEDQMAGIRYLSLVTIYVSSTADIFINGVVNSPWLPLILGAFSLAGIFSGIMFKIRGLLLLGSVFLLLSIITMIWYASANFGWTWLWYVAGIATGATIIFMFAVFEKKRSEVLRMVEGLKQWEV